MTSQPIKKNLLVTLSDENYLEYAKQLFSSVYWNSGWKGDYMLLTHNVPEDKLVWFRNKGILIYKCEPITTAKIGKNHHPATVFDKLHLFDEYFNQWKKVIFLDTDIIVRASLDGLLSIEGFAAPNATSLNLRKEFYAADHNAWKELKRTYPLKGGAFCTGVFAFDTEVIEPDMFNRAKELTDRFGKLSVNGEEGVINLLFYRAWNMLPMVYNTYPFYMDWIYGIKATKVKGIILHFISPKRPWNKENPFYKEWLENFQRAEDIDLSQRKEAIKIWTNEEIEKYGQYIQRRGILYYRLRIFWKIVPLAERFIGQIGLVVKKVSPRTYEKKQMWSLYRKIDSDRKKLGIQMHTRELFEIAKTIRPPMNILVFGLGNDSAVWHDLNVNGKTVFIEDQKKWFDNIKQEYPFIEAHLVDYGTQRTQWKELLDLPEKLKMNLPYPITEKKWDIIIVYGPAGYADNTPGRMRSIYMASQLVKKGGDVFVHDSEREIEKEYSKKYLLEKNKVSEVSGRALLCHFKIP